MLKYLLLSIGLMTGNCYLLFAQEIKEDTIYLSEVKITGLKNENYQVAGNPISLTENIPYKSLSEKIQNNTPAYMIQYGGKGQLSVINLRGLGGSRTNLSWNGIEINSFTLGQSDYSLINGFSGDVALQKGSNSALFGNGAIGGVVNLTSKLPDSRGHAIQLTQGIGSFGEKSTSVGYRFANLKWSFASRFYYLSIENDFPYNNRGVKLNQSNAAYLNRGFTQDAGYWINPHNQLVFNFWYSQNNREIQPNKGDLTNDDFLKDNDYRFSLKWLRQHATFESELKVGYTDDHQNFNDNSTVQIKRSFLGYQISDHISENISYKAGFQTNFLKALVESYEDDINELRTDLFASLKWEASEKLSFGINLREPVINEEFRPFSPSVSSSFKLLKSTDHELVVDAQVDKSYRIPTLNDRYWNPGGNPDLLSEQSSNFETGFSYIMSAKRSYSFKASSRFFYHDVDNWIIWRPGGVGEDSNGDRITFWFPDNIRKVVAKGIETEIDFKYQYPGSKSFLLVKYSGAFTSAVNRKALNEFDRSLNKQLPFTPKWVNQIHLTYQFKGWALSAVNRIVGERFVETNNELPPLEAYYIMNLNLSKSWKKDNFDYAINLGVNNLSDVEYENFSNRAMPGRSYSFLINVNYNF